MLVLRLAKREIKFPHSKEPAQARCHKYVLQKNRYILQIYRTGEVVILLVQELQYFNVSSPILLLQFDLFRKSQAEMMIELDIFLFLSKTCRHF